MRNRRHRGAGLLPAAVEEIKRLRAEWAALKDTDLLEVSFATVEKGKNTRLQTTRQYQTRKSTRRTSEVLRGVVALVEVGAEPRALPLRAALTALGATVVPLWSPLVTHVVWSEGGDRESRKEARASAANVVSPLWVEACATSNQHVSEKNFPAAARPSDLPSPNTMLTVLRKAEEDKQKKANTSKPTSTVTSRDLDSDDSDDTGHGVDHSATDVEMRVNTLPRRALPQSYSPYEPRDTRHVIHRRDHNDEEADSFDVAKRGHALSRRALPASAPPHVSKPDKAMRKLFTQREVDPEDTDSSESGYEAPVHKLNCMKQLCSGDAVMRRRVLADPAFPPRRPRRAPALSLIPSQDLVHSSDGRIRIVLTGMSRTERRRAYDAVRQLGAKVQKKVTYRTTHVVLGSFGKDDGADDLNLRAMSMPSTSRSERPVQPNDSSSESEGEDGSLRTLSSLAGAARGCRVVCSQWAFDSARQRCWLAHKKYAVPHLEKISEKAYLERRAFDLMDAEYAYNVFRGRRVRLSPSAENRRAAEHLLALCGAVVANERGQVIHEELSAPGEDGPSKNPAAATGRRLPDSTDRLTEVVLGTHYGQVSSRWVFDSVARARMRGLRGYTRAASG